MKLLGSVGESVEIDDRLIEIDADSMKSDDRSVEIDDQFDAK
jgi:hypothetical protein